MPGMIPGSEWDIYFDDLADAFGLRIERVGPYFGSEHLVDVLAVDVLAGEHTRILWPDHYDLRRIPVRHPTPVYPHSLIWHQDNTHPALGTLREYLAYTQPDHPAPKSGSPPGRSHECRDDRWGGLRRSFPCLLPCRCLTRNDAR
jgi:hypothetical protein